MHPSDQDAPMWTLVRLLEHEEVERWRRQHHPGLTLEGSTAQHLTEIQTEVKRRPGGKVWVTVSILARRAFECEHNAFRLQRVGNRLYKVLEPDEISTSD
jgi:hypothetical protein